jgi:hypothetical protein
VVLSGFCGFSLAVIIVSMSVSVIYCLSSEKSQPPLREVKHFGGVGGQPLHCVSMVETVCKPSQMLTFASRDYDSGGPAVVHASTNARANQCTLVLALCDLTADTTRQRQA